MRPRSMTITYSEKRSSKERIAGEILGKGLARLFSPGIKLDLVKPWRGITFRASKSTILIEGFRPIQSVRQELYRDGFSAIGRKGCGSGNLSATGPLVHRGKFL